VHDFPENVVPDEIGKRRPSRWECSRFHTTGSDSVDRGYHKMPGNRGPLCLKRPLLPGRVIISKSSFGTQDADISSSRTRRNMEYQTHLPSSTVTYGSRLIPPRIVEINARQAGSSSRFLKVRRKFVRPNSTARLLGQRDADRLVRNGLRPV